VDEAIARFQTVLKLQPALGLAHNNLAMAWLRKGRPREAIARYEAFLKLEPDHTYGLSSLAWVLATWPEAEIRDRTRALELAQRANDLSGGEDPMILRTLAAAQAENGRFEEAVKTARRALERAEAASDRGLGDALRAQLERYEAGAPFRDSGGSVPSAVALGRP
jgi:protein O-mannosyl-transferase